MAVTKINAYLYTGSLVHNEPDFIPTTAEDWSDSDTSVEEITITNVSSNSVSVYIADKQSTPRAILDTTLPAKSFTVMRSGGRFCPGGITWVAGEANALVGYIRARVK